MIPFQPDLQNFISTASIDFCPRAILLRGYSGCDGTDFALQLSEQLNFAYKDYTPQLIEDALNALIETQVNNSPTIYYINVDQLTVRDQNALLRTIESPSAGSIFVLFSSTSIISTLVNRCRQLYFVQYSKESLRSLCPEAPDLLIKICHSPSQIAEYIMEDLTPYQLLADNMFKNFERANISNVLTIPLKFKWTKQSGATELNFDLFLLLLAHRAILVAKENSACIPLYKAILELVQRANLPNIDKRRLFDSFLLEAKSGAYKWS